MNGVRALKAGQIIMTGTLTPITPVQKGSDYIGPVLYPGPGHRPIYIDPARAGDPLPGPCPPASRHARPSSLVVHAGLLKRLRCQVGAMPSLRGETAHPVENHLPLYAEKLIDRFSHGQLRRKRRTNHRVPHPFVRKFASITRPASNLRKTSIRSPQALRTGTMCVGILHRTHVNGVHPPTKGPLAISGLHLLRNLSFQLFYESAKFFAHSRS